MKNVYRAAKNALGFKSLSLLIILSIAILAFFSFWAPKTSKALCCFACSTVDCLAAVIFIKAAHEKLRTRVKTEFDNDLSEFEDWLIEVMFKTQFLPAMADMTTQMSAVAMQYTEIIGSFLDAQNQMETQRLLRTLQFEAHKDYRPSEGFCAFGTNVKSLAASENKARFNALALSQISLARQLGTINMAGSTARSDDYKARWEQFADTYCDPSDNNFQVGRESGLELACKHDAGIGATNHNRVNRDIDYVRLIEEPRTLELDFTDNTLTAENDSTVTQSGDEEDVLALSRNLYGHKVLSRRLSRTKMPGGTAQKLYLALRSIAAKRSVAQASFNAIIGLKSSGTSHETSESSSPSNNSDGSETPETRRYLAAIMAQLLPADPVDALFDFIGQSPSYYAQLEILAKRIYQNPTFYANLYDTPANVSRKKVAMKAIELMVDRALYESQLRREMTISVLLSSRLRAAHKSANKELAASRDK